MRIAILCLVIWAATTPQVWAQEKQEQGRDQQQDQQPQQPPPQRPTLGPHPAPSPGGPSSSTTADPRKLMRVRTVYVEIIDNLLSEKLADGISKMGRFRVVAKRDEADAVLTGTCSDLRRLKTVHSEVYLNDRASGAAIWQDSLRRPYNPPPLGQVVNHTASDFVAHLEDSVKEAERK